MVQWDNMTTLTQSKSNKGLLTYCYNSETEIIFAATHITDYAKLPNNELLIRSAAGTNRLKFIDSTDRDAAIVILDATMNLTSTEAFAPV